MYLVRTDIYEQYRPSCRGTAVAEGAREDDEAGGETHLIPAGRIYTSRQIHFPLTYRF